MARFLQLNLSVNAAILNCYGPHVIATTDSEPLIAERMIYGSDWPLRFFPLAPPPTFMRVNQSAISDPGSDEFSVSVTIARIRR